MKANHKFYLPIVGPALATGLMLLVPLVAMQFSDEVAWTLSDFIIAGALIFGTGLAFILTTRNARKAVYRFAVGLALFSALFLLWANGAVGIIGSENNRINLVYFGVIAVGITGAWLSHLRARGMAVTLFAMAAAQAVIAIVTLLAGMAEARESPFIEIISVNGFFILLFSISAFLFRSAARKQQVN